MILNSQHMLNCQFCVCRSTSHDFTHSGHFRHDFTSVKRGVKDASQDFLSATSRLLQNHCPMSITQQFLDLISGGKLPPNSIAKQRKAVIVRKHDCCSNEATLETLIRVLSEDDFMSFVRHTSSCDGAKQLEKSDASAKRKVCLFKLMSKPTLVKIVQTA